jgi:hypothetical protein
MMKCCIVAETDFWQECFIFCNMVHHGPAKFKTYHPVIWCYVLQYLQSVRPESKAFSKNFLHSWLWYIQLAASLTCWLPWTSLISLPITINCFRTCTQSAWSLPLTDTTCVHKLFIPLSDRIRGWGILFELSSEFSLNSYRFHWMKLQHTKHFFWLSRYLASVLYSSGKSWNYFLRMCAIKTFWVALYNGVHLNWLRNLLIWRRTILSLKVKSRTS